MATSSVYNLWLARRTRRSRTMKSCRYQYPMWYILRWFQYLGLLADGIIGTCTGGFITPACSLWTMRVFFNYCKNHYQNEETEHT